MYQSIFITFNHKYFNHFQAFLYDYDYDNWFAQKKWSNNIL